MSSKAEQIMSALYTALKTPSMSSIAGSSVFRDLDSALNSELPAVVIEEGNEPAPDLNTISIAYRYLEVKLLILIKGTLPFSLADAGLVEAYNRVMADRTLGGVAIDIVEADTSRERAMLEKPVAIVAKNFRIKYRTGEDSLTT